jgi:hypothetical protein
LPPRPISPSPEPNDSISCRFGGAPSIRSVSPLAWSLPYIPVEPENPPTLFEAIRTIRAIYLFHVDFLVKLGQLNEKHCQNYREQMKLLRHVKAFSDLKWIFRGYTVSERTGNVHIVVGYLPASQVNTATAKNDDELLKIFEVSADDKDLALDSAALFLFFLQSPLQLTLSIFQALPTIGFKSQPAFYSFKFNFQVLKAEEYPSFQRIERQTVQLLREGISRFKQGDRSRYQYLWRWDTEQTMPFHLPVQIDAKLLDESSLTLGFSCVNTVAPNQYSFIDPTQDPEGSAIDAAQEEARLRRRERDSRQKKKRSERKRDARKCHRHTCVTIVGNFSDSFFFSLNFTGSSSGQRGPGHRGHCKRVISARLLLCIYTQSLPGLQFQSEEPTFNSC